MNFGGVIGGESVNLGALYSQGWIDEFVMREDINLSIFDILVQTRGLCEPMLKRVRFFVVLMTGHNHRDIVFVRRKHYKVFAGLRYSKKRILVSGC